MLSPVDPNCQAGFLQHAGQYPGRHDRRRDDDDVQPERSAVPRGAALSADPVADHQPGFQRQPCRDGQPHCHVDHPLQREGLRVLVLVLPASR
jgi:hypothetical protein